MAIALVATVALAHMQVRSSQPVNWKPAKKVDVDKWPISFQLPEGLDWTKTKSGTSIFGISIFSGEEVYTGSKDGKVECRVTFYVGDGDDMGSFAHLKALTYNEQSMEMLRTDIAGEEAMVVLVSKDSGSRHLAWCYADHLDGTTVSVNVESSLSRSFALELAEWICKHAENK